MESEVLQMEEDEDAGEQDAEDKEEEEDPKEDPQDRDQQEQEQRIFKSSSISPSPGPEGNEVANEALLQEGSGSASSGLGRADGVPAPLSPSSTKAWPHVELQMQPRHFATKWSWRGSKGPLTRHPFASPRCIGCAISWSVWSFAWHPGRLTVPAMMSDSG